MKDVLQNKWLTIFAAAVVVALSLGCFFKLDKDKKFQQKQELLLSNGMEGFLERTRNEKLRFSNEEVQRENEKKAEQERDRKEQAVKNSVIPKTRHDSYVRMYNEVKDIKDWMIP